MTTQVNYFEIGTQDPEGSKTFYNGLFGWGFGEPSPVGYRMINTDAGGMWDSGAVGGGHWAVFYVQVDDVASSLAEAERLGATVVIPLTNNGAIEFAHLGDPEGNRFGIWRPLGTPPE
ncbi:VOC family protein [Sinomonas sp. ASV486]|uniref:VOC family protein n=1 Tax=Sinomonas sp. ASV486 TaxID=3051170 RepID=UPI0027DB83DD|nr:VOC family protein [Sinomonas sp. ASV486]MDQ4490403.1 VOC family protein [Sinomonas sp. ASV486]